MIEQLKIILTKKIASQNYTLMWSTMLSNYFEVLFFANLVNTNPNVPSNLYWAKIWCIKLEKLSYSPWIRVTCLTKLKSGSPFKAVFIKAGTLVNLKSIFNYMIMQKNRINLCHKVRLCYSFLIQIQQEEFPLNFHSG